MRHLAMTKGQYADKGPMLETLDYTIRIGSAPTFLYFDMYLYSAYAAHYVYMTPRGLHNILTYSVEKHIHIHLYLFF